MVARRHGVFGLWWPLPELGQRHTSMRQDALARGTGAIPDDASSPNTVDGLGDDGDGGSMTGYFNSEDDCWYDALPLLAINSDMWAFDTSGGYLRAKVDGTWRPKAVAVRRDTSVVANTEAVFAGFWSLP